MRVVNLEQMESLEVRSKPGSEVGRSDAASLCVVGLAPRLYTLFESSPEVCVGILKQIDDSRIYGYPGVEIEADGTVRRIGGGVRKRRYSE